jgi:hypothetical protein
MKIHHLTDEFLKILSQCSSLDSALELTKAKEADVRRQLTSAGFDIPTTSFMQWHKLGLFMESNVADEWQFMLDLNTAANALNGTWIPVDKKPDYYEQLKESVFKIRNGLIHSAARSASLKRVGVMYEEIKQALLVRSEPKIVCRFNPHKELFTITFDNDIDFSGPKRDWVDTINRRLKAIKEGKGKDAWAISYGVDTQSMKSFIRNDTFQHQELLQLSKALILPY